MILIIIFSFNRAMQLDALLKSIKIYFIEYDFEVKIIYHCTGDHALGYKTIIDYYKSESCIKFVERSVYPIIKIIPFSFTKDYRGIYRFLKAIKGKQELDNFKYLLETEIEKSSRKYIIFCTDDSIFYRKVKISNEVLAKITEFPESFSYRMYVGKNCKDFPILLYKPNGDFIQWNYYDESLGSHWNYPFSVDSTIYDRIFLLKLLKKIFYFNPSTLEGYVNYYVKKKKIFALGMGPIETNYVNLPINGLSKSTNNFQGNINVDFLNSKFILNYRLKYLLPNPVINHSLIPDKIILSDGMDTIEILKDQIKWEKRIN